MSVKFISPKGMPKWFGKRFLQVSASSWRQLGEIAKIFERPGWVFRGQAKSIWSLDSSLDRMIRKWKVVSVNSERRAINDFRDRASTRLPSGCSQDIDILACMQHYGTPTRLLDFTVALNVALWFALGEETTARYSSVWALNLETAIEKSEILDADIVDEAGKIAARDHLEHDEVMAFCEALRDASLWGVTGFVNRVKMLADQVLNGHVRKESGILPITWDGKESNERMKAQRGMFVMPLGSDGFAKNLSGALDLPSPLRSDCKLTIGQLDEAMRQSACGVDLVKIVIDRACRAQVLEELERADIRADTIYPDLEGVAKSISY